MAKTQAVNSPTMKPVKEKGYLIRHIKKEWMMYSLLVIPIIYFIIFKYVPMFGNIIAFRKYTGGSNIFGEKW